MNYLPLAGRSENRERSEVIFRVGGWIEHIPPPQICFANLDLPARGR